MNPERWPELREKSGLIATVVTTGVVESSYAECLREARAWMIENDFRKTEWKNFPAVLVESGRDEVVKHALKYNYDWVLQADADATFLPNALVRLLETAYLDVPESDMVGAYCQLKGSYLSAIDTGTGTWEPWFPGNGVIEVMRTGGHFILTKTSAFKRFPPPWFRTREAHSPAKAMADLDNFARMKLDGKNPWANTEEWRRLRDLARAESPTPSSVGEDSAFCDALIAAGGRIFVNTDVVTGHVDRRVIEPQDLADRMLEREKRIRSLVGVYE